MNTSEVTPPAKKWRQYFADAQAAPNDLYYTPEYAMTYIQDAIKPFPRVWEPCCGAGHIVRYLEREGHTVFGTDIAVDPAHDLFTYAPPRESFDIIVTNPPFTGKRRVIERFLELDVPFAMLMTTMTLNSNPVRNLLKRYGDWGILMPDKSINFIPATADGAASLVAPPKGSRSFFHSSWFTYKVPAVQGLCFV